MLIPVNNHADNRISLVGAIELRIDAVLNQNLFVSKQ